MAPEALDGGVERFPTGESQLVGHEHEPPLRVPDLRPVTRLVQRRRIHSEGRIVREWQHLDRAHEPDATDLLPDRDRSELTRGARNREPAQIARSGADMRSATLRRPAAKRPHP